VTTSIPSVDEAVAVLLADLAPLQADARDLDAALGGVLAERLVAPFPLPRWTNAAMDGYAVRADDVRGATADAPKVLTVVAHLAAGASTPRPLGVGEAMRIFTGAPVPDGADSVVRQEDSDLGTTVVRITADRDVGRNVRVAGSDLAMGADALPRGTIIGPGAIALLASLGVARPMVHRTPRVAVLSTGDELTPLHEAAQLLAGDRLADSNTPALAALTTLAGATAIPLGPVPDDPEALATAIRGAETADLIVTVGGVSVGDHDHVPAVIRMLGGTVLFRRVRLRPGGPTTAARLPDGRLWLALPGNPVSAMVTFTVFARPVIRRLAGEARPVRRHQLVRIGERLSPDAKLELCLRGAWDGEGDDGMVTVRTTGPAGSALMTSMRGAELLVRVPPGSEPVLAGTLLRAIAFP
jgi:molybdopterin molybdotransferase